MGHLIPEKAKWQIPAYAQNMLWVRQADDSAAQATGPRGVFALDDTGGEIALVWGTAEGPVLARWPDVPAGEVLGWTGSVGVAGFVERLHVFETRGLEVVVAEIEGDVLPAAYRRVPTLADYRAGNVQRRDETDIGVTRACTYTMLALADSVYAEYLHHAMVSELAVDCFATLGPQEGRWHEIMGLPLLIEALSLLAPG
jgi:hypothetical protein